jgi:pyruvate dehydrogenase E2 component (dihydrolipoamide acetyltransferase)
MEEGNIISWLKNVGDSVSPGDVLAEVETDKATMDLESFHEGVLLYVGVDQGPVPVDGIIAVIGQKGEDFEAQLKEADKVSPSLPASLSETSEPPSADSTPSSASQVTSDSSRGQSDDAGRIKASPLARKIAADNQISLAGISGSGEGGRIIKRDVEGMVGKPVTVASVPARVIPSGETQEIPLSQMRKTIAKRLAQSKFSAPHFYLTVEINMNRAVEARSAVNASGDVKVSFNDIVVKAAALALRKHPMVNASWTDTKLILHGDINIGVAVAVEEGLVVPVVRNADHKGLVEINAEVKDYAIRARDKKLQLDEMQGNTFTISNLGMFGIDEFTAIINPPDSCILAVGSIVQKPIVENGEIAIGNIMKVTLSCDHRVVDGAKGAQFLQTFRSYLENPLMMLV